jgi:exodeoxyribonuclease VII large subunit
MLYFILNTIKKKKWMYQDATSRLMALSPLAVLKRGYSITRSWPQKTIIKNARRVQLQQSVEITLASGSLRCRVEGKASDGEKNL